MGRPVKVLIGGVVGGLALIGAGQLVTNVIWGLDRVRSIRRGAS